MNKFLALFASVMSTTAIAQETAVKQPEFWSPVVEHQIQRDIPQYLGYTDNAGLLMSTYDRIRSLPVISAFCSLPK